MQEKIDVDFEFFDPQPHDYLAIQNLLKQMFSHDAPKLDLGALSDAILAQPLVGSTVKCDGHESDPYGFCTVFNVHDKEVGHFCQLIGFMALE